MGTKSLIVALLLALTGCEEANAPYSCKLALRSVPDFYEYDIRTGVCYKRVDRGGVPVPCTQIVDQKFYKDCESLMGR